LGRGPAGDLLGLPRLFAADHLDGTLEQMALSPSPLGLLVAGKILAHWLLCGLPLVLLAPVLGCSSIWMHRHWAF
jgi:heme exporter protein B